MLHCIVLCIVFLQGDFSLDGYEKCFFDGCILNSGQLRTSSALLVKIEKTNVHMVIELL